MTFTKGTSGNPNGRPRRTEALSDQLRAHLAQVVGEDGRTTRAEVLARILVEKALEDELDGRVPQPVTGTADGPPLAFSFIIQRPSRDEPAHDAMAAPRSG
jgi:hypothetical protein